MRRLVAAGVRQALLGLVLVGLSLPPLFALSQRLGLGRPEIGGLALLGGSAVLGFAAGGVLGALLASSVLGGGSGRLRVTAPLGGLVLGVVLCAAVLPLYLDSALDDATDAATESAATRIGVVLGRPSRAWDQAGDVAGEVARAGAARLPALALLGWTLLGPVVAAPLEARQIRRASRGKRGR